MIDCIVIFVSVLLYNTYLNALQLCMSVLYTQIIICIVAINQIEERKEKKPYKHKPLYAL